MVNGDDNRTKKHYESRGFSKAEVEILTKITRIETTLAAVVKNHVTQDEFRPVKNIVYGMVGIMLTAVLTGLIALLI